MKLLPLCHSWKAVLQVLLAIVQDIWKVSTIVKTHYDLQKPCFCQLVILKAAWIIHIEIWFHSVYACSRSDSLCQSVGLILNSSLLNWNYQIQVFKRSPWLPVLDLPSRWPGLCHCAAPVSSNGAQRQDQQSAELSWQIGDDDDPGSLDRGYLASPAWYET